MPITTPVSREHKYAAEVCLRDNLRGDEVVVMIREVEVINREDYEEHIFAVMWQSESRDETYGQYGTHRFMINDKGDVGITWGHYDMDVHGATRDFKERV